MKITLLELKFKLWSFDLTTDNYIGIGLLTVSKGGRYKS